MNEVFVPESPEHNTWQPGQQLPLPPPHPWQCSEQDHSSTSDAGGELYTVLQSMQSSIESGFQDMLRSLFSNPVTYKGQAHSAGGSHGENGETQTVRPAAGISYILYGEQQLW